MIDEILAYTSTYLTSQQKENRKQKLPLGKWSIKIFEGDQL